MSLALRSIVHPTDFSDLSNKAFVHALRIALAAQCKLDLLHVAESDADHNEIAVPHLRQILAQWRLMDDTDQPSAIFSKLGVHVENVRLEQQDPTEGLIDFFNRNTYDLAVFATHGRDGFERWLKGSIAETVFSKAPIPTLFIPGGAHGFVSQVSGDIQLRRGLVPVDFSPRPDRAIEVIQRFGELLVGKQIATHLLHVGSSAPPIQFEALTAQPFPQVILRQGNVVDSIVDAAVEFDIDVIGMPTAGHQGILDALRGSTTERVIRYSPCPVLAIPAV